MPPKMTANPARPARYRAGKPTGAESASSSEDEDSDSGDQTTTTKRKSAPIPRPAPKPTGAGRIVTPATLAQAIRGDPSRAATEDEQRKAREAIERKAADEGFVTESEEEESSEDDDDGTDSDEESSSEDDMPARKIVLPKFMTKAQRERAAAGGDSKQDSQKKQKKEEEDEEAAQKSKQEATDALLEEQLRKQAQSRVVNKKQWEDTLPAAEQGGDVDVNTDDDVDEEAEYAAWKLRELKRIKRQRERIEEKEREIAEIERRRNLTEEERAAEDAVHLAKQREEKDSRGKMAYMAKYHHKGAFYQDEAHAEGLDKRDLMGARFVDEIRNRELLPKALQLRDMTKLGRKGASKYRDMRSEDTGRWGVLDDDRSRQGGYRGGDGRRGGGGGGSGGGYRQGGDDANGANAIPLGDRKGGGYRDRDGGRDGGRDRYRDRDTDRRRSRSRSPRGDRRRDDYGDDRRKRSPPRDDRDHYDKRRRVDT